LSPERFSRYLEASNGDPKAALRLYTWNCQVASALYGPLQTLEVTLRNSVHDALSPSKGARWFSNAQLMKGPDLRRVADAEQDVRSRGVDNPSPGDIVGTLSFGFWVGLFAKSYDQELWRVHLYKCFHPRPRRNDLHENLDEIRKVRNRVAHHEPIYHRLLLADYERILDVIGALSPDIRVWVEHHSRFLDVFTQSPSDVDRF